MKTKSIIKNNFNMPPVQNEKFLPVNKSEAKDTIYTKANHRHEVNKFQDEDMKNISIR
jgi:hypothetical protein